MVDYTKRENRVQATQGVAQQAVTYDQGLRSYMLRVYNHMALGLGVTGLVAMVAFQTGLTLALGKAMILLMLVEVGLVIYFSMRIHKMSEFSAKAVFYLYAALNGLTFSVLLYAYTADSVAKVFFITASMFGVMSLWGYTTKRDLTGMGQFLIMGAIGLMIASLVNLFMHSSGLSFAISYIGVVVFTGLVAYDTQKIKETYYLVGQNDMGKASISGALTLYLDFINLMIMLLRIIGDRR